MAKIVLAHVRTHKHTGGRGAGRHRPTNAATIMNRLTRPKTPRLSCIIVSHQAADVYDVLEFRLRNNDRDLQTLLSRSADRLANVSQRERERLSERQRELNQSHAVCFTSEERERTMPPSPPPEVSVLGGDARAVLYRSCHTSIGRVIPLSVVSYLYRSCHTFIGRVIPLRSCHTSVCRVMRVARCWTFSWARMCHLSAFFRWQEQHCIWLCFVE